MPVAFWAQILTKVQAPGLQQGLGQRRGLLQGPALGLVERWLIQIMADCKEAMSQVMSQAQAHWQNYNMESKRVGEKVWGVGQG